MEVTEIVDYSQILEKMYMCVSTSSDFGRISCTQYVSRCMHVLHFQMIKTELQNTKIRKHNSWIFDVRTLNDSLLKNE